MRVSQKKLNHLEDCAIKSMWLLLKNKILIYQSKANLDMKILFGKITHLIDPKIRKTLERSLYGNQNPYSILVRSMIYSLLQFKFISEKDNGMEFEFQSQVNHGRERNVELLISKQTAYWHFLISGLMDE